MAITTFYVVKGGMFSVVITEVMQFCILSIASIARGHHRHARRSAPEMLQRVVPAGWDSVFFGWHLNLDWSSLIASVNAQDRAGRLLAVRLLRHDAALQGHPGQRRGPGAQLRHAAHPLHAQTRARPR